MRTRDVRIDVNLNRQVWSRGIRNVPRRIRLRLSRHREQDEKSRDKFYTVVSYVPCDSFKGLLTENILE
jgi:large subunit ribosomal protein L31e